MARRKIDPDETKNEIAAKLTSSPDPKLTYSLTVDHLIIPGNTDETFAGTVLGTEIVAAGCDFEWLVARGILVPVEYAMVNVRANTHG